MNKICDYFFLIDIVLNFRTTYRTEFSNQEELSSKKIALNYIRGFFWIDLLSALPLESMVKLFDSEAKSNLLEYFAMLKLFRVLRL